MFGQGFLSTVFVMLVLQLVAHRGGGGLLGTPVYWLFGAVAAFELLMLALVTVLPRRNARAPRALPAFFLGDLAGVIVALVIVLISG